MKRLAVSVEGQTEESFVNTVLADHLRPLKVEPTPILVGLARGGRGGDISVGRLAADMARLYWNFDRVTSLVDFYGFRGKESRTVDDLEQLLCKEIQTRVSDSWDQRKVVPYVQKHEFEGLLFSDVSAFRAVTDASEADVVRLGRIRSNFPTPEDINDSPDTAPSKRIAKVIPRYGKVLHGPLVAEEIGLTTIREQCPRFGNWISRLESLDDPTATPSERAPP